MNRPELTERTTIEALAIELVWAVNQGERWTEFGRDDRRLTVWWTDGVAYYGVLIDQRTRRPVWWDTTEETAGEWVLDRLRQFGVCLQIQDIETSGGSL